MKITIRQKIFLSVLFLLSSTTTMPYRFKFSNVTDRILIICYRLETLSKEYYQILFPDQSISHYFPNAHCFGGSILWAEVKQKDFFNRDLPFRGGLDLINPDNGELLQDIFMETLAHKYAFIPMQIKVVSNETFEMTAQAAQELMEGIDLLSCQTIKTVAQFMTPMPTDTKAAETSQIKKATENIKSSATEGIKSVKDCRFGLGKIAKGGANLAGVTLCRENLHFLIVDTGEVGSPTPGIIGASRARKPILIAEINQGG